MRAEENILRYEGATQDPHQLLDLIQEIDQQTSNLLFLVARSEDANIYEGKFKALKEEKQALQPNWKVCSAHPKWMPKHKTGYRKYWIASKTHPPISPNTTMTWSDESWNRSSYTRKRRL